MNRGVDRIVDVATVAVGAGVAGLTAALDIWGPICLLSKTPLEGGSASNWAQGGIAAAVGEDDSPVDHASDTVAAGAGLCDPEAVKQLTLGGPSQIHRLIQMGAGFDRDRRGDLSLGQEAAHRRRRILHAGGDATGAELTRTLTEAVRSHPSIRIHENFFAEDLVVQRGKVAGVVGRDQSGAWIYFRSGRVVLACGGIGQLYSHTTNPPASTGDGIAMAARAGVRLADLEFVQFHPTALKSGQDPMPLLTEALRGEGAVLLDSEGVRFMQAEHQLAELAPRDVVARAIWKRKQQGLEVYLDARHLGKDFPRRFPTAFRNCQQAGFDPRSDLIPVSPAAHYHIGGIAVDCDGRSSLPGLWACGEVAATGVHGANRLASNSLLEAMVFGNRVARSLNLTEPSLPSLQTADLQVEGGAEDVSDLRSRVRTLMWRQVGLVRTKDGLKQALSRLSELDQRSQLGGEERNLLLVARLVAQSARRRQESRGVHFRKDYPIPLPRWRRRLFMNGPGNAVGVAGGQP